MFPLFCNFRKKVLDPNRTYISMIQTKIWKFSNFGILCIVVCSASTAYTSLCRNLNYLLKIIYITLVYSNVGGYLIFETHCLGRSKILPHVWKKYHDNERHFCLVTQSFTKLSLNVCLINTLILMYWDARCDIWFYFILFLCYFQTLLTRIHFESTVSSPNFHRMCV